MWKCGSLHPVLLARVKARRADGTAALRALLQQFQEKGRRAPLEARPRVHLSLVLTCVPVGDPRVWRG
jgi:hypothetical protein